LLGFGRFGTTDPWLGIPVTWDQISYVHALVECDTVDFHVDPSLGTHFFQNLTAREIGFFSVSVRNPSHFVDWPYLLAQPTIGQHQYLRHVRFPTPMAIKIDGRSQQGVVLKPR
jgi:hypothetical protein